MNQEDYLPSLGKRKRAHPNCKHNFVAAEQSVLWGIVKIPKVFCTKCGDEQ